jgi:hypothetical protein
MLTVNKNQAITKLNRLIEDGRQNLGNRLSLAKYGRSSFYQALLAAPSDIPRRAASTTAIRPGKILLLKR